jgi:uncharacterized protein YbjT (DUF2867 family)
VTKKLILVTGATGYIAGKLIPQLLKLGYRVRCLARRPQGLSGRTWFSQVEVVSGDVSFPESLPEAMRGVSAAYYLIHSMSSGRGYTRRELEGARNFALAAQSAGLQHIIYLGGLADPEQDIAPHMRSRIQTGEVLRQGSVPVTEFRASLIIGSGSISFEMIRYLTEGFPVVIGPRWLRNHVQPVATQTVLEYLLAALDNPNCQGEIFEIGGPEVMSYAETLMEYARLRGLKRSLLTVPSVPVGLMAFWVDRFTPVPILIARPLIEGLNSDSLVQRDGARKVFPKVEPIHFQAAVQHALGHLSPDQIERVWMGTEFSHKVLKHEGFFVDCRQACLQEPPEVVYRIIVALGGLRGWLYLDWLWNLRGWVDRLLGGPGMRGRRDPETLYPGEAVDFYRVEALEPGHMLRLRSELVAPGEGWMEWRVESREDGSWLCQTAFFAPKGLPGFLYWYLLYPFHASVFAGLAKAIARCAGRLVSDR